MNVHESTLQIALALEGVSSLSEIELSVGDAQLEVQLPGGKPCVVTFPASVESGAAPKAKFSRKTGALKLSLPLAAVSAE